YFVQTGDVEAYGATFDPMAAVSFPSLDYWASVRQARSGRFHGWLDLFGNHDVWPSTLPIFAPLSAPDVEPALRRRPEFNVALPISQGFGANPWRIEFYPLNTIETAVLRNSAAQGRIATDPNLPRVRPTGLYPTSH